MTTVKAYLETLNDPDRKILDKVYATIKSIAPDAEEVITYGMPGFKYRGKYLISFMAFRNHYSIFPGSEATKKFADDLANFKTSKGTIQFTTENPLPDNLLIKIVKNRIKDINGSK